MKKTKFRMFICLGWLLSFQSMAVYINHKGLGDAMIIPYYTVNNNLNTLVTVNNTTEHAKAIKINIREGLNGYAALSYNVYLDAFDTWTFALIPTESTVANYQGQPSAMQVSFDWSCAPFLVKSGQQFLPFGLNDGPNELQRTREGFIEIIEMGDLNPGSGSAFATDMGNVGVPANCSHFESAWDEDGIWHEGSGGDTQAELLPGSGGLLTEAQIIDVNAGINYSIPTIALDGFLSVDNIVHASPGDVSLSLDAAEPVARVIVESEIHNLQFENGIDAVSAVLLSSSLLSTYVLDTAVAAQTELVYSQPTRRFYVDPVSRRSNLPPYSPALTTDNNCSFNTYWGVEYGQIIFDRESQLDIIDDRRVPIAPPRPPKPYLCGSVFILSMQLESIRRLPDYTNLTGSYNFNFDYKPQSAVTENGFVRTDFIDRQRRPLVATDIHTGNTIELDGIPIIGVSIQRFTNANAGEGLLAQYGGSYLMKSFTRLFED